MGDMADMITDPMNWDDEFDEEDYSLEKFVSKYRVEVVRATEKAQLIRFKSGDECWWPVSNSGLREDGRLWAHGWLVEKKGMGKNFEDTP